MIGTSTAAGLVALTPASSQSAGSRSRSPRAALRSRIGQRRRHFEREPRARAIEEFSGRAVTCRCTRLAHAKSLTCSAGAIGKNMPTDGTPNIARAVDLALLAELDEIIEQRARDLRPQIAAHVKIGLEPAGAGLGLEAQQMVAAHSRPSRRHWCGNEHLARPPLLDLQLDRQERRVIDD